MELMIHEYGLTSIAEISTTTTSNSNYVFPITDENVGAIFKADPKELDLTNNQIHELPDKISPTRYKNIMLN